MNKKSKPAAISKKDNSVPTKVGKTKDTTKAPKKKETQLLNEFKFRTPISGTRTRTSVVRFSTQTTKPEIRARKPTVPFNEAEIEPIGNIAAVVKRFKLFTDPELKSDLHQIIFQRPGKSGEKLKHNILTEFNGFNVTKDKQKENLLDRINKLKKDKVSDICYYFCLPLSKTKEELVETLYEFFLDPHGVEFDGEKEEEEEEEEEEEVVEKPKKDNKRKLSDTKAKDKKSTTVTDKSSKKKSKPTPPVQPEEEEEEKEEEKEKEKEEEVAEEVVAEQEDEVVEEEVKEVVKPALSKSKKVLTPVKPAKPAGKPKGKAK